MKKICMIVQNLYDIDPRVRRKAECLVEDGFAVDVIALQPPERTDNPYLLNGVRVFGIPLKKRRASLLRYLFEYAWFFIRAYHKATQLMKKNRYMVIDINTLPDFLVFAAWSSKHEGAKVILDLHESMPEFYQSKFKVSENHPIIRILRWQERISMNFADSILTIHEPMQALFENRGLDPAKATIITNSADTRPFQPFIEHNDIERKSPFVFMYHGTLTSLYGLDSAINAFSEASKEMPGAELWIIGDGPKRESLNNLIENLQIADRVKLVGSVPKDDIPQWLARCDAGVLPTSKDLYTEISFSNKLPEYIIMNKPVLVSRLKTIKHYFREESLLFFEAGNVKELAQNMHMIYEDKLLRNKLVSEALKDYEAIDWSIMRERYIKLIRELSEE